MNQGSVNLITGDAAMISGQFAHLPTYKTFRDCDRENNNYTRKYTGAAVDTVQGITVGASDARDGSGAFAYVTSCTRPGFAAREFSAETWQEAFDLGEEYRQTLIEG